jgi:hypothetical protein
MLGRLHAVVPTAVHAGGVIADRTAADPYAVLVGTALYVVAQAVRTRAWFAILRAAFPEATGLGACDVMRAVMAGSGINAFVPGRGGDLVKLVMVHRRIEGSRYPTLVATFVPDSLSESAFGVALVIWALAKGFLPGATAGGLLPTLDMSLTGRHLVAAVLGAAAVGAFGWWLLGRLRAPLRQGTAILGSPKRFVTGVASWQALARVIRLGSIAAFMTAFGLPVTPATVVLVMAVQGAGRIVPFGPASAGLRMAMLAYGFVAVTGHSVDMAAVTAFTVGGGAVLAMVGLAIAVAILALECGTRSPWHALATARTWACGSLRPAPPARVWRRTLRRPRPAAVEQPGPAS